jgi:hypothetical protein
MNKNRIRGIRRGASWQLTDKPISIKSVGCKFGGYAPKAVGLTSGELLRVAESVLQVSARGLNAEQKSAEGKVAIQKALDPWALHEKDGPERD